jgi:hypothetical protein
MDTLAGHPENQPIPMQSSTSGWATPMPENFSSTPAWDPSSRTPIAPLPSEDWSLPTTATIPPSSVASNSCDIDLQRLSSHSFLDRRLIGANLKALVNGEGHKNKEMVVTVADVKGKLCISCTHYNTSRFLQPDSVVPKHPNVTRDNGLLVVIKGAHCGKLVRRIYHQYIDGQDFIYLAVVKKVDGTANIILSERLLLSRDSLCVGVESKEEKKLNNTLMNALREDARLAAQQCR